MLYIKKNKELEEADQFLYQEELYLRFTSGRWELYRTKQYSSKEPIQRRDDCAYSEAYKCYVHRFWDLIAAPKHYLIEQGFKLKV